MPVGKKSRGRQRKSLSISQAPFLRVSPHDRSQNQSTAEMETMMNMHVCLLYVGSSISKILTGI